MPQQAVETLVSRETGETLERRVSYFSNVSIDTIEPPKFDSWEDADDFAIQTAGEENALHWLHGMAAANLPAADGAYNFDAWCTRNGMDPGRIAVYRRCYELYDFQAEVRPYPRLKIAFYEKMMGRVSKIKERARKTGDYKKYQEFKTFLEYADANGISARDGVRQWDRLQKGLPLDTKTDEEKETPSAFTVRGATLIMKRINVAVEGDRADWRDCLVLVGVNKNDGTRWAQWAAEALLLNEPVDATFAPVEVE